MLENLLGMPKILCQDSKVCLLLDLPKPFWKKGIEDLLRVAHSWITQLDGWTDFGMADSTFDHNV